MATDATRQAGERVALSVVIPTLNEQANIAQCIESVLWADEIFVVDSGSTDGTPELAQRYPVQVVQFQFEPGGLKKYNWSLEHLPFNNEWVLFVDTDERISPGLAEEIKAAISGPQYDGYHINLQYIFLGKWLRHCWNPVWRLRLFKHRLGRYERFAASGTAGTGDNEVHEAVILQGRTGYLDNYIIHHDFKPFASWIEKHNRYSTWEAATAMNLRKEGPVLSPVAYLRADPVGRRNMLKRLLLHLPGRPLLIFLWLYVWRRGFLDGYRGLAFSLSIAYYWLTVGIKMKEAELVAATGSSSPR